MVPDEFEALSKHKSMFKSLLVNEGYRRFIMDSFTKSNIKTSGLQLVDQTVKIDLRGLRNFLQQEGAIKKFGL